MNKNDANALPRRERRSHTSRLTVDLPSGTLTALKIHVARRETTIRAVVTSLIQGRSRRRSARMKTASKWPVKRPCTCRHQLHRPTGRLFLERT